MSYNIYIGQTLIQTINLPANLTYTYTSVTAGQSYQITVSAVSVIGEGPKSNPLIIWAVDVPTAPVLSLTDTSRSSCSVQWTAVNSPLNSLITGYVVYIDDGLDGNFVVGYDGKSNPSKIFTTI